ncbi:hypothetical protein KDA_72650 [Dictyobacter alpinus]|uniref:Uncharacterized protein n=1 Tax=Dictyobacter alpinus TaxID=2014873 RepID=A0A402BKA8_9CHLR|nr:hypothetical protein [Dictyobacter alpinus]GCE31781.1 hypothetical protein KDA_72650 [Dictyobacter alpinus]
MKRLKKVQSSPMEQVAKFSELSDEQLMRVSGGLNPQPLPPGLRTINRYQSQNQTNTNNISRLGDGITNERRIIIVNGVGNNRDRDQDQDQDQD